MAIKNKNYGHIIIKKTNLIIKKDACFEVKIKIIQT